MAHFLNKFSWQNKQLKQNKVVYNFKNGATLKEAFKETEKSHKKA